MSKRKSKLKQHILSVHEGVRYSCSEPNCNFQATTNYNLKRHFKVTHGGFKLQCDLCTFTATQRHIYRNILMPNIMVCHMTVITVTLRPTQSRDLRATRTLCDEMCSVGAVSDDELCFINTASLKSIEVDVDVITT